MKLSALLRIASLTIPVLALVPTVALASDEGMLGSLASGEAQVRASLSTSGLLGTLSPVEGAIVTGLVVFAMGCVIAVIVARHLDRDEAPNHTALDLDTLFAPRAVPSLYSLRPATVGDPVVPSSGAEAPEFVSATVSATVTVTAQLPAHVPNHLRLLPGASSPRMLAAVNAEHEPTLVGWPPAAEVPADRPSQEDTCVLERSGIVPTAGSLGVHATGIVVDAVVVYEPGNDPDATTQFVRGRNLDLMAALAAVTSEKRTILPPTLPPSIRPIPISAPRAIAPANLSDLTYDDSPTEIGLPPFEEVSRELTKSSEIRVISTGASPADVNETQAFLLVRSG